MSVITSGKCFSCEWEQKKREEKRKERERIELCVAFATKSSKQLQKSIGLFSSINIGMGMKERDTRPTFEHKPKFKANGSG